MRHVTLKSGTMIAVVLMAASAAKAEDSVPGSKYYPVAVGTEWVYVVKAPGGDKEITSKIVRIEEMGGVKCVLQETSIDGNPSGREHLRGDAGGMKRYSYNGMPLSPPVEFLKAGVKKGDKWSGKSEVAGQKISFTFEAISIDEKVKVPAGDYTAMVVKASVSAGTAQVQQDFTLYYAPGVGQVRTDVSVNGTLISVELKSFKKGK